MNIITRQQWGARHHNGVHKNGQPLRRKLPASEIWLHHSVAQAPDLVPPFDDQIRQAVAKVAGGAEPTPA